MVGTGVGAKNGILIKGGRALEASRGLKRIVLDKTGTVTEGKLTVASLAWAPTSDLGEIHSYAVTDIDSAALEKNMAADGVTTRAAVIAMVAATEARSEHPLAKAIATWGKSLQDNSTPEANVETFESVTGQGVRATIALSNGQKYTIWVGSTHFITQSGDGYLPSGLAEFESSEAKHGRTLINVAIASSTLRSLPVLAISLSDAPKRSSARAIRSLQDMGIEVNLLTGDARETAVVVAQQVGIKPEDVWAGMSPKGKATVVTELIEKDGSGVAMVGDGINDSPALAAATVGIALSSGTSVAIEAADIVLMRSDLLDVVAALDLSCSIFGTIRRNLIWACIYNVLGIPLAMGIFLPLGLHLHPMMAGAMMAFSSVSVVSSSLLLRRWVRPANSVMPDEQRQLAEPLWTVAYASVADVWDALCERLRFGRKSQGYAAVNTDENV
jgi:Cu+-exporting ATPase